MKSHFKILIGLISDAFLLVTILAIVLVSSTVAWADDPVTDSTDAQRATLRTVLERFGVVANVDENGVVRSIGGERINIGLTSEDPLERVYQFFELNSDLFQLVNPRDELQLWDMIRNANGTGHIKLFQKANGVKVVGGEFYIHFIPGPDSNQTLLYSIDGNYFPGARLLSHEPSIGMAQAESLALADPQIERDSSYIYGETKLLIAKIGNSLHLLWKVPVSGGSIPPVTIYWVDALSQSILKTESGVIY